MIADAKPLSNRTVWRDGSLLVARLLVDPKRVSRRFPPGANHGGTAGRTNSTSTSDGRRATSDGRVLYNEQSRSWLPFMEDFKKKLQTRLLRS